MRIAKIIENDIVDCDDGICVSLWTQGCPHKCPGCHNQHAWDKNGGEEIELKDLANNIISLINKNGINRNFSILGGEPLAPYNRTNVALIINKVKKVYPNIKLYIWTGYTMEELKTKEIDDDIKYILSNVDVLIDGRFEIDKRDITLKLRGSPNQRIWERKNGSLQTS